jgi:hypothetical protein
MTFEKPYLSILILLGLPARRTTQHAAPPSVRGLPRSLPSSARRSPAPALIWRTVRIIGLQRAQAFVAHVLEFEANGGI